MVVFSVLKDLLYTGESLIVFAMTPSPLTSLRSIDCIGKCDDLFFNCFLILKAKPINHIMNANINQPRGGKISPNDGKFIKGCKSGRKNVMTLITAIIPPNTQFQKELNTADFQSIFYAPVFPPFYPVWVCYPDYSLIQFIRDPANHFGHAFERRNGANAHVDL